MPDRPKNIQEEHWKPLGKISDIEMGQSPPSNYVFEGLDEGLPFLQGNAEFGVMSPYPKYSCVLPAKIGKAGSLLISVRAPVGAVNIADQDYCIGRGLAAIFPKRYPVSFVAAAVSKRSSELARVSQGTTFDAIGKRELNNLCVYTPDQSTASKIAEILDTLDEAIRATEAVVAKLKAMKQGLLHDLLTRGIDANGDLRPSQSEAPHLYKQTPLGWLPKKWEACLLDDVALRGSGHTPSKSIPSYWNGGIRWVSLADSHRLDQVYIRETDKEISEAGLANSSAVRHPENTVILSRDAGIGKSAILASEMAVSQHFMAWRCGTKLNYVFLYYLLQREKPRFEAIAMGSTIKTIGLSFFKKYMIALPPKDEQDQIGEILLQAEDDIVIGERELQKLRATKSGLMDDLLTGRTSVTPLL